MMGRLTSWLLGSVRVEATGADIERYLNACTAKGVAFSRVERLAADRVALAVGLDGYFTMRGLSRRHMCRLRVTSKTGAPFYGRRLEKRWGLLAGLGLAIAVGWYLSGFVWTIGIGGQSGLSQRELLEMLSRAGLETGARISRVDPRQVRDEVMLMTDSLSFFTLNLRGTHAQVTVWGREEPVPMVPQDVPCDVVADKTGVIVALRVREGLARVKVGETVMPGDLIATGTLTSTQGEVWQVHASAEADLRVWHSLERRLPQQAARAEKTGEQVVRRALMIGDRRINLYLIETEPFAWYDKKVEKTALNLGEDFRYPIMLITETYSELELRESEIDRQLAAQVLEHSLREALAEARPEAEVLSLSFEMEAVGGVYVGKIKAECIETAGIEREIQ